MKYNNIIYLYKNYEIKKKRSIIPNNKIEYYDNIYFNKKKIIQELQHQFHYLSIFFS